MNWFENARFQTNSIKIIPMRSISKLKMILTFIVCLIVGNAVGQDIQLTIIAPPPHPSLLSEFQESSDNYRVNITNLNAFQNYNIIIQGRLTSDNGIEAQFSEDFNDYQIIEIPAGSNQTFLFEELGNYFDNLSLDDIDYSGGPDVAYLIQSQRLPDGIYSICIEARDFDSRELLSLPLEANCSNPIIIQSVNPPVITNPLEEQVIEQVEPTLINIAWTPVIAPSASIVYDLRLAEFSELVNPYDAIENENFLQFEESDIRSNVFIYNQSHTPLIPGKKYIVRVRARDENNSVNIFNQGWSDIVIFSFGPDENAEDPDDNPIGDGDFACMSPCVSIDIPDLPDIPSINMGDIFRIGHFNLRVDNFQQTVNGYSGSGVIKASDFIPKDINVNFQDIRINGRNMVTSGAVNGVRKAAAEAFSRVDRIAQNSNIDDQLINRLYDELLDPAADMISDDINESLDDIAGALSLPISFGEGAYKIHIPDMTFTAEGATVSMLSGYEWQGDYLSGSEKLVFGSDNICITPGGISLTEETLKLDILKPYDFDPSEVFSLHINGREGDNPSYIDFDCDGINEVVLNGYLAFNNEYVSPLTDDFDKVNGKKLVVDYNASFTDWDEILISANTNNNGTVGANYFSSKFELKALPEFKFSFDNLLIDLSENENKPNMIFPDGYGSPDNWTGVVVDELQIQLPDYFENNNAAIHMNLNRFLIDDNGVSFNFRANNLQELSDISIGGWGMSVSEFRLDLLRNNINLARLDGNMKLPICENSIGVTGEIERVDNKLDYSFDLDVRENIEIPMWASKFRLNEQCRILAKIEDESFKIGAVLSGELELDESIGSWDQINIKRIRFEDMIVSNSAPYFETGNFDIDATVNATFGGFNINLKDISFEDIAVPGAIAKMPELGFNIGFKFGDQSAQGGGYFSADSRILLRGKRNNTSGNYSLDRAHLQRIEIDSEVSAAKVKGSLDLYDDHPVYGDGIGGAVDISYIKLGQVRGKVLFGNIRNFDYWYVDAGLRFPSPITLVAPIDLLGFSGGAYYNMRQTIDRNAPIGEASITYEPRRDGWGFRIGTVWATTGVNSTLNGNAHLLVDFGNGGSLSNITLTGKAKMLDEPSFSSNDIANTELLFNGIINYNHVETSLSADFGYQLDVPRNGGILTGGNLNTKNISLLIAGLDNWHLYLGLPRADGALTDMLDFQLNLGYKVRGENQGLSAGINGYFNIGSSIPGTPPLPERARNIIGNRINYPSYDRAGVGFGLHTAFDIEEVGFDFDIIGLLFSAGAGFGFDATIQHKKGLLCNGRSDFGVNQWYGNTGAYLYAYAGLEGILFGDRYNLGSFNLGARLNFAGPNPFYSSGKLVVSVDPPIIDRIRFGVGFSIGERCQFTTDENAIDDFIDELGTMTVLEPLVGLPAENIDFLDADIFIDANFMSKPNREISEYFGNRRLSYKVEYDIILEEYIDNEYVEVASKNDIQHMKFASGKVRVQFNYDGNWRRRLSPGKDYRLVVSGALVYREGFSDDFQPAIKTDGSAVAEIRMWEFSTTDLGDYEIEVVDIIPQRDRFNLHVGDLEGGFGHFHISNEGRRTLNELGQNATLKVQYTQYLKGLRIPTGFNGAPINLNPTLYNGLNYKLGLDHLAHGYDYDLQIMLVYLDAPPIVVYEQSFGLSQYSTLAEKVGDLGCSNIYVHNTPQSGNTYRIPFIGPEDFESPYEYVLIEYLSADDRRWNIYRNEVVAFAKEKGFFNNINAFYPEFVLNQSEPIENSPPFFGIPNLNIIIDEDYQSPSVEYIWRPNQFVKALRDHAISNYFGEIYTNDKLRSLFFGPHEILEERGLVNVLIKSDHQAYGAQKVLRF